MSSSFAFFSLPFRRVRNAEAIEDVREAFAANPHLSTRRNPFVIGPSGDGEDEPTTQMSRSTLQLILKEDLKMRPYHLQMAHALDAPDPATRMNFARDELMRLAADPDRLNNLLFTDEAHFHLDGGVNRHDWIMWADSNPHWFDTCRFPSPKVTVWMGVGIEGVIGPIFWEPSAGQRGINSQWLEQTLVNEILPRLRGWPNFHNILFQQDGAPCHIGNNVLTLLDREFPGRWIGRGTRAHPSPAAWPPRSPDLTPCDFWLWGYMKGRIFNTDQRPRTLDELRTAIVEVADQLRQDRPMRERVMANYHRRLQTCLDRQGGQVEIR